MSVNSRRYAIRGVLTSVSVISAIITKRTGIFEALDKRLHIPSVKEVAMKNHTHPEFKGSRRSRKDPMALPGKSRDLTRKGQGKRSLNSAAGSHSKALGH